MSSLNVTTDNNATDISNNQALVAVGLMSSTGGLSVIVCITALLLVVMRKRCTLVAYRLGSYQVIVALVSGIVYSLEAAFIGGDGGTGLKADVCKAVAYLMQSSHLAKLLVSACLTFHTLAFAVCHKDLRRLEVGYIVLSLALPLVVSVVPLVTGSYGKGTWCWINPLQSYSAVLQISMWYAPAAVTLAFEVVSIVLVVCVTAWRGRAERKRKTLLVTRRLQKRAVRLDQIVPLLAYPIAWTVLVAVSLVSGIYEVIRGYPVGPNSPLQYGLLLTDSFSITAWSLSAGVILIVHVVYDISSSAMDAERRLSFSSSAQESVDVSSSIQADHCTSYQRFQDSSIEVRTLAGDNKR